jgi:UDP-N-acetylmuramyl tripeptide synthase
MVLTNLFRDQLDRYGEIDITMNLLKKAMDMAPDMKIIVNADDALSAYLAMESGHSYVTYGISEPHPDSSSGHEIREGRFCKRCGEKLVYDFYHFSQLGVYHCPKCGFKRPFVDFDASGIDLRDGLKFSISSAGGEKKKIRSHYRGFYNAYNILACWSLLKSAGLSAEHFDQMLDSYHPDNGRNESFRIGGSSVLLNLAKNPAGFNQNISAVMEDREEKDLIIVINDNAQDGKDVSWLWDVDFDRLDDPSVRSVTVSGIRCQDMRLRLKYVSIQAVLTEDVRTAVEDRLRDGCGNIYLLVNYTALYSSRRILKEMSERSSAKTAARA